ncbi:MAG: LptF/LptG family permease, partial [Candidatus Tectomicrobia bacterium]|nr:LptF/LptG family permease [Candidatus Tectomicrobia bacterium]
MKKLHRYIFGEVFTYFLLCLFLLTFVLLLNRIFQLTDLVVGKGVPFGLLARLLLTLMPVLLLAALPAAALIACILAFSRLSNDSESIAMTATGMSLYSQLVPVGV